MTTRNETLMIARQATANGSVQAINYSDRELAQREAMGAAIGDLRALAAKWQARNAAEKAKRERSDVISSYVADLPEIVTSVRPNAVPAKHSQALRPSRYLADTLIVTREEPFLLSRPVLRGKVSKACRISAIGNFFRAVSIFVSA